MKSDQLSVINDQLLMINDQLKAKSDQLKEDTDHSSLTTHHSSLITHHSSLITNHSPLITIHSSFDFIAWLKSNPSQNIMMITTHPQRWTNNTIEWMIEFALQNIKNFVKHWFIIRRYKK